MTKSVKKKALLKGLLLCLIKPSGDIGNDNESVVEVNKSVDVEQRRALFVVLEPDVVDAHGDTYSAEEVEKACINFNTHCNKANLFHRVQTEDVKIEQSFINPSTFTLEDGREIKRKVRGCNGCTSLKIIPTVNCCGRWLKMGKYKVSVLALRLR